MLSRFSSALRASFRNFPGTCRRPPWNWPRNGGRTAPCGTWRPLIVADAKSTLILSGNGDVIEPDDGLVAIGSGGPYALSAARALLKHSKLNAKDLAMEAMRIASEICIYTNANFTVEEL